MKLILGDSLEKLKDLPTNTVDAVVTDPPYGLAFMGKKWDYDVPSEDLWREVFRVMKPGAHLLSFFGTRTYHAGVTRIEAAGFEVRDMLSWLYGSGFPKSLNLKDNWQGWGTALKPANEPIVLARKPLEKGLTVAENVLKWGTGALAIDACRIEAADQSALAKNWDREKLTDMRGGNYGNGQASGIANKHSAPNGRWPSNCLFDEEAAAALDAQTGALTSGKPSGTKKTSGFSGGLGEIPVTGFGDSGGASRFFYVAKASKKERNAGLAGLPEKDPPGSKRSKPAEGRQSALGAPRANHHPTVKPLALMQYLIRLVTPPGAIVLDPFMGSGTTGCAAVKLGFQFIGIEREAEYLEIARRRIDYIESIYLL